MHPPMCGSGWMQCLPSSPTGRPYHPSGRGKGEGTRMHPPMCARGGSLPIPQAAEARPGDLGVYAAMWEGPDPVHTRSLGTRLNPKVVPD